MGYELEVQKIKKFWFCYFENKILMNSDQMQQLFSEQVFLKSYSFSRSFGYIQYAVFIHCIIWALKIRLKTVKMVLYVSVEKMIILETL